MTMAYPALSPEKQARLREAYAANGGNLAAAAREIGIDRTTAGKYLRHDPPQPAPAEPMAEIVAEMLRQRTTEPVPTPEPEPEPTHHTFKETGDTAQVDVGTPERIRTLEDAIAFAEVDLTVWRVESWQCTSWETPLKLRRFDARGKVTGETPHRTHQWRLQMKLARIMPRSLLDATNAVFEAMREHSPRWPAPPKRGRVTRPHLCVVDLFDVHFGKLAWQPETGEHYDLRIAEQLYRNAVLDILEESAHRDIEEFVLPLGQDFLHVDGLRNETTNGTPQDTDGRPTKIITTAKRAVIWAVEQMAATAPVRVKYVPGNHDRLLSWCLTEMVAAWFRLTDQVSVDTSPRIRKAHRYGETLICFTHGDEEKDSSLVGIMANEFKQDFASTTTHEWHRGHRHRPKRMETTPVNYAEGVVIRDLMSLSATDSWHYRKGFVGGTRAAEAYFYQRDRGFVAQFVAKARMGDAR